MTTEPLATPCYVNWNRSGLMWNVHRDMEPEDYSQTKPCEGDSGSCPNKPTKLNQLLGKPTHLQNRWFCDRHTLVEHRLVQIAQYNQIRGEGRVEFAIEGPRKLGYLKLLSGRFEGTK